MKEKRTPEKRTDAERNYLYQKGPEKGIPENNY